MDFRDHTVEELAASVRAGQRSARSLTEAALARIDALNPTYNAFVAVDGDVALAEADDLDGRLAEGDGADIGPLAGIPLGVKDLEDATGFVTTYGSLVHQHDAPAGADSVLVGRLRRAGCVVVGKTNTPELGHKGDTVNRLFGATRNPWNPDHSAGGSSGGSAAAVASGMVPLATASDGGGSIRIPAALCGLTALKPSLGRVPSGGEEPPGWADLSVKGPMVRTARDAAFVLDVVAGPEPTDLRSLPMHQGSWRAGLDDLHPPRKVLWSPTLGYAPVDAEVRAVCEAALGRLEGLGTEVVEVVDVFAEDPVMTWLVLTATGNLRTVQPLRGTEEWDLLEPLVRAGAEWAESNVSGVDVMAAQDASHQLNLVLVRLLHEATLLLTPTVAAPVPLVDQPGQIDGRPDENWVRFTYPFNLTRSPAGSVCAGFTAGGLPVGLQVVGPQHGDLAVLRLLAVLEDELAIDRRAAL